MLQLCRKESIDGTFDALTKSRPLNKALQACITGKITTVDEIISQFPELRSNNAIAIIQKLISKEQITDQKKVRRLIACLTLIELANEIRHQPSQDMFDLLSKWMTLHDDKAKVFLKENAEHLLSDEAFDAIDFILSLFILYPDQDDELFEGLQYQRAIRKKPAQNL